MGSLSGHSDSHSVESGVAVPQQDHSRDNTPLLWSASKSLTQPLKCLGFAPKMQRHAYLPTIVYAVPTLGLS